ncbi:MAG TPA: DUF58 domain-containing protein [Polyangiales bacterium]|nr:DUF58 domain-containing protein [Polyangiales bacterium]
MIHSHTFTSALEKARLIELRTRRAVQEHLWGGLRSIFRGAGMDFDEVREYVPGDDVRAIDWSVTARAGRPFVKLFRQERELAIILAIDVSASGEFGSSDQSKRELAAELACVLALAALRSRDKVGLLLFSDHVERFIPAQSGRGHVLRLVQDVLSARPEGRGTDIAAALDYLNRVTRRRSAVILVSDYHVYRPEALAELERSLHETSRRHDLLSLWLTDPHESELPNVGRVTLQDAESGELLVLDTTRRRVREGYKNTVLRHRSAVRQLLQAAQVRSLSLSTSKDYMPALIGLLSGRSEDRSRV